MGPGNSSWGREIPVGAGEFPQLGGNPQTLFRFVWLSETRLVGEDLFSVLASPKSGLVEEESAKSNSAHLGVPWLGTPTSAWTAAATTSWWQLGAWAGQGLRHPPAGFGRADPTLSSTDKNSPLFYAIVKIDVA